MAQAYPARPVKMVVTFAAGQSIDILARLIGQSLSDRLGQQFVVENRPGAGGNIGTEAVVRSPADGYTLLVIGANNAINTTLYDKLNFNFLRDIVPVAGIYSVRQVMVVNPSFPARTVAEFIAYAKANPGKVNFASAGNGSVAHATGELFKMMTGAEMLHVPYRGASPAMQAVIANEVNLYLAGWGVGKGLVESGRVRALAVASRERIPNIPLPTAIESGVPDYVASNWWGLAAPLGTPQPVVDKVYKAVAAALAEPAMVRRLDELGFVPVGDAPPKFAEDAKTEAKLWAETISRGRLAID